MGYRKISSLYKNQTILMFKEVYVSEKIHGTSACIHMTKKPDFKALEAERYIYDISFFSGGADHDLFVNLFDKEKLIEKFKESECSEVVLYGEAYGGKLQGMRDTYGDKLKFIVFEAKVSDYWLNMERAEYIANQFEQEFVWYTKCKCNIDTLNKYRDQSSVQAKRNGIEEEKKAEGIVIRPLIELTTNNGGRLLVKHKRDDFRETKTKRNVMSGEKLKLWEDAKEIAEEWVTPMRLTHVLDKLKADGSNVEDIELMGVIVKEMINDVEIEAEGEIVYSHAAKKEVSRKTVSLFKQRLKEKLNEKESSN